MRRLLGYAYTNLYRSLFAISLFVLNQNALYLVFYIKCCYSRIDVVLFILCFIPTEHSERVVIRLDAVMFNHCFFLQNVLSV